MKDALFGRLWADSHEHYSRDLGMRIGRARARTGASDGDPLPIFARAMALVLAVSVSSLTIGAATF